MSLTLHNYKAAATGYAEKTKEDFLDAYVDINTEQSTETLELGGKVVFKIEKLVKYGNNIFALRDTAGADCITLSINQDGYFELSCWGEKASDNHNIDDILKSSFSNYFEADFTGDKESFSVTLSGKSKNESGSWTFATLTVPTYTVIGDKTYYHNDNQVLRLGTWVLDESENDMYQDNEEFREHLHQEYLSQAEVECDAYSYGKDTYYKRNGVTFSLADLEWPEEKQAFSNLSPIKPDAKSIQLNSDKKIESLGVIDAYTGQIDRLWTGSDKEWEQGAIDEQYYTIENNSKFNITSTSTDKYLGILAYNEDKSVILSSEGYRSTDGGITWTELPNMPKGGTGTSGSTTYVWKARLFTYLNGKFILHINPDLSSASKTYAYSEDNGETWVNFTAPAPNFYKLIYDENHKRFIYFYEGCAYYSNDLITWNQSDYINSGWVNSGVVYSHGIFFNNSYGQGYRSTDGINWVAVDGFPVYTGGVMTMFATKTHFFVMGMEGYNSRTATTIYASKNGISWTEYKLPYTWSSDKYTPLNPNDSILTDGDRAYLMLRHSTTGHYGDDWDHYDDTKLFYTVDGSYWMELETDSNLNDLIENTRVITSEKDYSGDNLTYNQIIYSPVAGKYLFGARNHLSGGYSGSYNNITFNYTLGIVNFTQARLYSWMIPDPNGEIWEWDHALMEWDSEFNHMRPYDYGRVTAISYDSKNRVVVTVHSYLDNTDKGYIYNPSDTFYIYKSVGSGQPSWISFINGVGVKIGNDFVANMSEAEPQVQADWNQSDSSAVDYIKNKPTIPTATSDLMNDSGFLQNIAIVPNSSLAILGGNTVDADSVALGYGITGGSSSRVTLVGYGASAASGPDGPANEATSIGCNSKAASLATSLGVGAQALGNGSLAIGRNAKAIDYYSIQLGAGTNNEGNTLSVGSPAYSNYKLLDLMNGLIPDERLSNNIARTSDIPSPVTVDQTYDASSTNPQSGVAIAEAGFLKNTAIDSSSLAIGSNSSINDSNANSVALGTSASVPADSEGCVAVGNNSQASGAESVAIGKFAQANGGGTIQIGRGTNNEIASLCIGLGGSRNYKLLGSDGIIPDDRISSNIARTSALSGYLVNNTDIPDTNVTILGNRSSYGTSWSVNIGYESQINSSACTVLGSYAKGLGSASIAIGNNAIATGDRAIQIGAGTNSEDKTVRFGISHSSVTANYKMLDLTTGKIPSQRLTTFTGANGSSAGTLGAVPAPAATDNTKFLRGDGTWAEAGVTVDNSTINKNASNELQAIAVLNKNSSAGATNPLNLWEGTSQAWTNGEATPWYYWETSVTAMWQSGGSLPSSSQWSSVTYGDGKFVAVADESSKAAYSTDGINWIETTLPILGGWRSITYGNGTFVIVRHYSTEAAYSTDGINWTSSTMPSSEPWSSVTYGDGKFVAVTDRSNKAAYSTDGINWTASTLPSSEPWSSVTYGDGKFVAVAGSLLHQSSKAAYSTDGINWTSSTMPSSNTWMITYGNGKFVAAARTNGIFYSTDGINWTASTLSVSGSWQSITYGDGKFVAVTNLNKAAYSTDGINWIESTLPSSASWYSVTYGDGKFVAVASNSDVTAIFSMSYDKCYTLDQIPTTSTQVYSALETLSAKTITSTGEGTITLSDSLTYNYTPSGNQNTYRTIGDAHPDWLCNIEGVGVKIGNTLIAEKNPESTVTIDSSITASSTNANAAGSKAVWDLVSALEARVAALESQLSDVETQLADI